MERTKMRQLECKIRTLNIASSVHILGARKIPLTPVKAFAALGSIQLTDMLAGAHTCAHYEKILLWEFLESSRQKN